MSPKFIMMVGLVASGKSTMAKQLATKYDAIVFSSDELRTEMFGDVNDQSHNGELFAELHRRIKDCLRSGRSAIMDATNISFKRRKAFIDEISNISCNKVCIVMATPYRDCLRQNKNRDRQVPKEVIDRMHYNFQCPHYFEGFDEIQIVYNGSIDKPDFNRGSLESMFTQRMKGFNQNNPHHIYDVFDHSKALMFQYPDGDIRRVAAMLHDCMKKVTQTTDENGVSHYYGHANVSAYYVLTHPNMIECNDNDDILNIVFYINYHMLAHSINKDKTKDKYIKIFGEVLFDSLMDFAEKDKIASKDVIFNKHKSNIYILKDDYAIGYTRLGDIFYIDTEDIDKVLEYTWCVKERNGRDKRLVSLTDGNMKFLHRVIMGIDDPDVIVDHIYHQQNDNRKEKLRLCTQVHNSYNTSLSKNNTSGINGVSKMDNGRYRAYINLNYKQIHIGVYDTLEEAKAARDAASIKYYGEFANLAI